MFGFFRTDFNTFFESDHYVFYEGEKRFYIDFEVPGFRREDLEVSILDNELIISGKRLDFERKEPSHYGEKNSFRRVFVIPDNVDIDHISALLRDGILTVTLPKLQSESTEPRKIVIKIDDEDED